MDDSFINRSSSSSLSSSMCDSKVSDRFDQILEHTSSSTTEDDEHAHLYHRFDSVKSIIDEMYEEITHSRRGSSDCLHNALIVQNEGQSTEEEDIKHTSCYQSNE